MMKNFFSIPRFLICIVVLLFSFLLNAQEEKKEIGMYAGRYFLEFGIGKGLNIYGTSVSDIGFPLLMPEQIDLFNRNGTIGYYTLTLGNDEQKIRNIAILDSSPKAELKSEFADLTLAYAIFENIALGIKMKHSRYSIHNAALSKSIYFTIYDFLSAENIIAPLNALDLMLIETLLPLNRFTIKDYLKVNSLEFTLSYHPFDHNTLDPYIGLHAGYGQGNIIPRDVFTRHGIFAGLRYFLTEELSTSIEADYSVTTNNKNIKWTIKEECTQIKFGYSF